MRGIIVLASTLAIFSALLLTKAEAQATRSVWDGVYTDAQATRGAAQYTQHCALCHGANLSGTYEIPPLIGRIIPYWSGTTLDEFVDYLNTAMPEGSPGSLSRSVDADILAFMLKTNNFPSGTTELSDDANALKAISFDSAKPPPPAAPAKKTKAKTKAK